MTATVFFGKVLGGGAGIAIGVALTRVCSRATQTSTAAGPVRLPA